MPRQMYGLGSLVKSIGKTVKKIVKSPVAKVAMLGFGANALMPGGLTSLFSGGSGLTGILGKGKSILDGLTGAQKITGALALGGAFAGMEDQQVEELRQNPEALRSYLAQYYRNLNKNATDQEVNEFVESNMIEYKADGGRIGYREGNLAMGPGSGFTLKPPGELAYDATNTNIYGSSAASFSPKTIMNQSGDQVQAGFGKTPGPNQLFMGRPAIPGPATLPSQPLPAANPNGTGAINTMLPLRGGPELFMGKGGLEAFDNVPNKITDMRDRTLKPGIGTGENLEEAYLAAQKSAQEIRAGGMMGQVVLPGEMTFEAFSNNFNPFNSSGLLQAPLQAQAQPMPFAQQGLAQFNKSSPMAQIAGMANGGRMGYNEGTGDPTYTGNNIEDLPRGLQMDTTTSNPMPAEKSLKENLEFVKETKGGVSPSTTMYMFKMYLDEALEKGQITKEKYNKMLMPFFGEASEGVTRDFERYEEKMANGGRMGFAMGMDSPEKNAIQASGIMDLPLNQNPAGITELDLRETGGFIPPVGVKEKADDIPAMLSNNEFVFTADAVRGMGDGNVNKGAQRMYDMMKKLEKGGRV